MSSSVVLQVGQCGNQVGAEFWNAIDTECSTTPSDPRSLVWQHHDGHFRSVNVDTEPKVLRALTSRRGKGCRGGGFRKGNVIAGRCGRGSNWAMGYHGGLGMLDKSEDVFERTMDVLRKEIERCDSFQGIVMLHSLAGGTGSGVGSRLAELVRDEYSMNYLLSCPVIPFRTGESPLQQCNSVLALSTLLSSADSILPFDNDDVLSRLQRRIYRATSGIGDAGNLASMNRYIASCLAGAFLPITSLHSASSRYSGIGSEPWDIIRTLCPNPDTKILHVSTVSSPQGDARSGNQHWNELASGLLERRANGQRVVNDALHNDSLHSDETSISESSSSRRERSVEINPTYVNTFQRHIYPRYISSLGILRGRVDSSVLAAVKNLEKKVAQNSVSWNPFPIELWTTAFDGGGSRDGAGRLSLTLVSNNDSFASRLRHVLHSAKEKYSAKAFLHWFYKYGCSDDDFLEAFDKVESAIECYNQATFT